MSFRNTIIALVVLLIIGGYAFVNYYYSKPEAAKTALDIKPENIAKIDLKYPDRELVLERSKGANLWEITKPIGAKADQTTANNLARAIADAEVTKTVDDHPEDLAPFGLKNPATIVTVTTTKGKTLPGIAIGKTTPVGFSAYIKFTDKPAVMLTSSAFPSGMNKTLDEMRDKDLMTFNVDDVKKLVIAKDNGPEIDLESTGDNKWSITAPSKFGADSTQVRQVLSTLANTKVADFIADAPTNVAQYGLQKPHLTLTAYLKNGEQESLLLGFKQKESGKDGIYARRGERTPVYTIHPWEMTSLDKSILDLRDKAVVSFDQAAIDTIIVDSAGKQFTIKRAPAGKWNVIENGQTTPADVPVVERFLDQIRDLKGNSIVIDPMTNPEMFSMNRPDEAITITDKNGKSIGTVKLAKVALKPMGSSENSTPKTDYYVTSSASTAVFTTDDFLYSQLIKTPDEFKSKTAPTASPHASPGAQASATGSPRPSASAMPSGIPSPPR